MHRIWPILCTYIWKQNNNSFWKIVQHYVMKESVMEEYATLNIFRSVDFLHFHFSWNWNTSFWKLKFSLTKFLCISQDFLHSYSFYSCPTFPTVQDTLFLCCFSFPAGIPLMQHNNERKRWNKLFSFFFFFFPPNCYKSVTSFVVEVLGECGAYV